MMLPTELGKIYIAEEFDAVISDNLSIQIPGVGSGAMRPILPKNSHRVLGLSSQKAKKSVQSSSSRKQSTKKF